LLGLFFNAEDEAVCLETLGLLQNTDIKFQKTSLFIVTALRTSAVGKYINLNEI
jgi:hypothetical protein